MSVSETASDTPATLVRKLWQYCNVLRDDGLSYPDYVEQLTYLLFLKMSDETIDGPVPVDYGWQSLVALEPASMHVHYGDILAELGARAGMLGLIFGNAKNKIRDPAKLHLLVTGLIGQTEWTGLVADVKGEAYEGLLEKNAQDTKSGGGAVLHAAGAHRSDCRMHQTPSRGDNLRPGMWDGWLSARCTRPPQAQ